jgi:hypothetical protein
MEQCVWSARKAGVFKEFHVLTDRPIEGCECYEAQPFETNDGMFKLVYLKAGMSKLLFDYFIWIDADTWFVRNPQNVLNCLGKSPIHVPLETNLTSLGNNKDLKNISTQQYGELMTKWGVFNPVYLSASSFWIIHHDAIDRVCDLSQHFRASAKQDGFDVNVSAALGYAMQMLCSNPEKHQVKQRPDLWASDSRMIFKDKVPDGTPWEYVDSLSNETHLLNPAIIHVPYMSKRLRQ